MSVNQTPGNIWFYKKKNGCPIDKNDMINIRPLIIKGSSLSCDIKFNISLKEFNGMVYTLKKIAIDMLYEKIISMSELFECIDVSKIKTDDYLHDIINMKINGHDAVLLKTACYALICMKDLLNNNGVCEGFQELTTFNLFGMLYLEAFFINKNEHIQILPGCALDVLVSCKMLKELNPNTRFPHINDFINLLQFSVDNYVPLDINTYHHTVQIDYFLYNDGNIITSSR